MASTTNGGSPVVLGAVLILGALLYSRTMTARAGVQPGRINSMPGSAGTGSKQIVGGIVGSLINAINSTTSSRAWQMWTPFNPDEGFSYNPENPAAPVGVQDLVNGTVHDYYNGDTSSYSIPTTTDIFESATGGGAESFMGPGAYWS